MVYLGFDSVAAAQEFANTLDQFIRVTHPCPVTNVEPPPAGDWVASSSAAAAATTSSAASQVESLQAHADAFLMTIDGLAKEGNVSALIQGMLKFPGHAHVQGAACRALQNLAGRERHQRPLWSNAEAPCKREGASGSLLLAVLSDRQSCQQGQNRGRGRDRRPPWSNAEAPRKREGAGVSLHHAVESGRQCRQQGQSQVCGSRRCSEARDGPKRCHGGYEGMGSKIVGQVEERLGVSVSVCTSLLHLLSL